MNAMKKAFVVLILLVLAVSSFAAIKRSAALIKFNKQLTKAGIVFRKPAGFIEVPYPYKENYQVSYDYAIRSKSKKLEIRYKIELPGQAVALKQFNDPSYFDAIFMTIGLNIYSDKQEYDTRRFNDADVKVEFGADSGITSNGDNATTFGTGYKKCMIVAIHKKGVANAYIFYMYDDPQAWMDFISDNPDINFHSIKFK